MAADSLESPVSKNDLTGGLWSILVLSNNGQCAPIAYQRDFSISVGVQETTIYTPTVTFTDTSTPLSCMPAEVPLQYLSNRSSDTTTTSSFTITTTLAPPYTTTVPTKVRRPTRTIKPNPITITKTVIPITRTLTTYTYTVQPPTITKTATCSPIPRAVKADARMVITPTLPAVAPMASSIMSEASQKPLPSLLSAVLGPLPSILPVLGDPLIGRRWTVEERAQFMKARAKKFADVLDKRAPDSETLTVTLMDAEGFVTSSTVVTAPTMVITSEGVCRLSHHCTLSMLFAVHFHWLLSLACNTLVLSEPAAADYTPSGRRKHTPFHLPAPDSLQRDLDLAYHDDESTENDNAHEGYQADYDVGGEDEDSAVSAYFNLTARAWWIIQGELC